MRGEAEDGLEGDVPLVLLCHKHYNHLNKLIFFKIEVLKLMNQFNDIKFCDLVVLEMYHSIQLLVCAWLARRYAGRSHSASGSQDSRQILTRPDLRALPRA